VDAGEAAAEAEAAAAVEAASAAGAAAAYCDEKVANREMRVWHFVIERRAVE
jgi:hypothetical protein